MMKPLFFVLLIAPVVAVDMTGHAFVMKLNGMRRALATRENIPNMRELVWDEDLAVELINAWANNHTELKSSDKQYISVFSYENEVNNYQFMALSKLSRKMKPEDFPAESFYFLPFYDKIGCAEMPNQNYHERYCYLSPKTPLKSLFDSYGEAGSRCSEGYENHNGLCRKIRHRTTGTPPTPTVHTTGTPPTPTTAEAHTTGTPPTPTTAEVHTTGTPPTPTTKEVHTTGTPPTPTTAEVHTTGTPPTPTPAPVQSPVEPPRGKRHGPLTDESTTSFSIAHTLMFFAISFFVIMD